MKSFCLTMVCLSTRYILRNLNLTVVSLGQYFSLDDDLRGLFMRMFFSRFLIDVSYSHLLFRLDSLLRKVLAHSDRTQLGRHPAPAPRVRQSHGLRRAPVPHPRESVIHPLSYVCSREAGADMLVLPILRQPPLPVELGSGRTTTLTSTCLTLTADRRS